MNDDYTSYAEQEKKNRSRKIQTAEEYKKQVESEAFSALQAILPGGGQPQGFSIHIERWTDKDGHKHTKITFG